MCHSTGRAIVNKIKLLFIYVIFCFNRQTIASSTVRIACTKLRIYELQIGESCALNYEFHELQIDELQDKNHEFHELQIDELQDKNHEFHELHIVNCML